MVTFRGVGNFIKNFLLEFLVISLYLKFKFCIKISVDLHVIVRNNTELSRIIFPQFSSMVPFHKTIVSIIISMLALIQYMIFFRLPVLLILVCVCVCVFSSILFYYLCRFMYLSL